MDKNQDEEIMELLQEIKEIKEKLEEMSKLLHGLADCMEICLDTLYGI